MTDISLTPGITVENKANVSVTRPTKSNRWHFDTVIVSQRDGKMAESAEDCAGRIGIITCGKLGALLVVVADKLDGVAEVPSWDLGRDLCLSTDTN